MLRDISDYTIDISNCNKLFVINDEESVVVDKETGKKLNMIKIYDFLIPEDPKSFINAVHHTILPNQLCIPGISKIEGFYFPPQQVTDDAYIFSEFINPLNVEQMNTDYFEFKGQNTILNPTVRSKIIFGVASIMKLLHQHKIVHGNLRIDNVYLDCNDEPRINGTGVKENLNEFIDRSVIRTIGESSYPYHVPPEHIYVDDDEEYEGKNGFKSDVYSFSFFVFKMFSNDIIFDGLNALPCTFIFLSKIADKQRPLKQDSIPDVYWSLIQNCWKQNPNERPSFDEIVEILKNDEFALNEFGRKTNLDELHNYQCRFENYFNDVVFDFISLRSRLL